jgi:hypothetical protein
MNSPEERKARTETLLASLGVPLNRNLPLIEPESEVRTRSAEEVAKRCGVLLARAAVGHSSGQHETLEWLTARGLWESTSNKEKQFFQDPAPSEQSKFAATWEVEKINVFLWALGYINTLALPCEVCDVPLIQRNLPPPGLPKSESLRLWSQFIQDAKLISVSAILDALDLTYRIDRAVVECRIHGQPPPAGFNPGVVYERHYALNWLTCYADDWDEITCDT